MKTRMCLIERHLKNDAERLEKLFVLYTWTTANSLQKALKPKRRGVK